ncbi:MAG: phosphate/phosphite/phosphonate ABC transporter substrate-binding protein [Alphaproteobacteria bacterium]|nr:phosphate/phosphite/phosphonate ABC transporter substrate-binding protein [Alphaproteobacteria bacterium]
MLALCASFSARANGPTVIDPNDTIGVDEAERPRIERSRTERSRTERPENKESTPRNPDVLSFGFDIRSGPLEDARQYLPFLEYLSEKTGHRFKLKFTSKNSSIVEDLGRGVVDFAAIGAVSFIEAYTKHGAQIIARGVNKSNKAEYRSAIVVRPDSAIGSVAELEGKRLAFGSVSSTQGHLIPRIVLQKNGLMLSDLRSYAYTGSHLNCANAVIKGEADACGMQDTMAANMAEQGLVRILHMSAFYPSSGIAANKNVPPGVIDDVLKALLAFDPLGAERTRLYNWDETEMPNGFQAASPADYGELQNWLVAFGLLTTGQ